MARLSLTTTTILSSTSRICQKLSRRRLKVASSSHRSTRFSDRRQRLPGAHAQEPGSDIAANSQHHQHQMVKVPMAGRLFVVDSPVRGAKILRSTWMASFRTIAKRPIRQGIFGRWSLPKSKKWPCRTVASTYHEQDDDHCLLVPWRNRRRSLEETSAKWRKETSWTRKHDAVGGPPALPLVHPGQTSFANYNKLTWRLDDL